jgi:hypothetical protein
VLAASIFRAMNKPRARNRFLARGLLIALNMKAASTSETSVNFYQTTLRKIQKTANFMNIGVP